MRGLPVKMTGLVLTVALLLLGAPPTRAATSVANAQKEVDRLRTLAATKFEQANALKYQIDLLQVKQRELVQTESRAKVKVDKVALQLSRIAVQRYQGSGFGNSMELLFSEKPFEYLRSANSLEILSRNYQAKIQHLKTYKQELQASQTILRDRTSILLVARTNLAKEVAGAQRDLQSAEKVLSNLSKSARKTLLAAEKASEARVLLKSKKVAKDFKNLKGGSNRGAIALQFALNKIGDIYVWGGAGPTRWDCSGLTLRSFARAGVSLPHSAAVQFNYGKSISFDQVQPGDLLFFGRPISHVSIYIGNGLMVQAPRPGKKVEVAKFSRSFGYKPFIGARRI